MPLPQGEIPEVGAFYYVRGQGVMLLRSIEAPSRYFPKLGRVLMMRTPGGSSYTASEAQLVRRASDLDVRMYINNLKMKGVVDIDFIPCW